MDSYAPVEEYKLFFRRLPDSQNDLDNSIEQLQPLQHHTSSSMQYNSQTGVYHSTAIGGHHRSYVGHHWRQNDWRDVVLPAMPLSHLYTQSMSYMIRGLDPDQHYEARVQARWVFLFVSISFSTVCSLCDLSAWLCPFFLMVRHSLRRHDMVIVHFFYFNSSFIPFECDHPWSKYLERLLYKSGLIWHV